MFKSILDDAEAKQAAQAKHVELTEHLVDEPESLLSPQSSPTEEYSSYVTRSPQSSAETALRNTLAGRSGGHGRNHHSKGRHSTSSARSPSPAGLSSENEDDRVVACLLARNTRSWMPRTPRRRSSRDSDY